MRIGIWHNLSSGGGKRALYYHCRGLYEREHELEIWCPENLDGEYLPLTDFGNLHEIPLDWNTIEKKGLFQKARSYRSTIHRWWSATEVYCKKVAKELNGADVDIVLVNTARHVCTPPLAKYLKVPCVIYLQEPLRYIYEARKNHPQAAIPKPKNGRWWMPGYLHWFIENWIYVQTDREQIRDERENAAAYDRILVNSRYSRESILRAYGLDTSVCYLGVDGERFTPNEGQRGKYVVGMGAFLPTKGVDRIIKALGSIPEKKRPPLVWIANVANADYLAEMQAFAAEREVLLDVKTALPDGEVVKILQKARCMVYASRLEPFGFAPLEANACGTPVVAIAEGGVRETIRSGENGMLVDDADPIRFGLQIEALLDDPRLVEELGRKGREMVLLQWGWDKAIDMLEREMRDIMMKEG